MDERERENDKEALEMVKQARLGAGASKEEGLRMIRLMATRFDRYIGFYLLICLGVGAVMQSRYKRGCGHPTGGSENGSGNKHAENLPVTNSPRVK